MKIQIASDLHLEFLEERWPKETVVTPADDADLLILAGDVANGADVFPLFCKWPVPVLFVAGNHEFYGLQVDRVRSQLRAKELQGHTAVRYLEHDELVIDGVRFLGCTLWTDYELRPGVHAAMAMVLARGSLNDHRVILTQAGVFTPADALREHQYSRAWLQRKLSEPFDGKTVVVTHHGCHLGSQHPRYAGDVLTSAFISDMSDLMQHVDLWVHGHVHDSFDYQIGRCRVVVNPAGYAGNRGYARDPADLRFENENFDRELVVEIESAGEELSVGQTARLLHVSRAFVLELAADGHLGVARRVTANRPMFSKAAVLKFKVFVDRRRASGLKTMIEASERPGLYDDEEPSR